MEQFALSNSSDKGQSKELDLTYIFETYYKRIYNYIYYRVNSNEEAEDLTSQVFEKVMLKIDTYSKDKANFEVWLFAIARNVINDGAVTLRNLHIIYCFANLKLAQYVVVFILNMTAPLLMYS